MNTAVCDWNHTAWCGSLSHAHRLEMYRQMQLTVSQCQYLWGPTVQNVALLGNIKCERVCERVESVNSTCRYEFMRLLWAHEFRLASSPFGGEGGSVFIVSSTAINLGPLKQSTSVIPVAVTMDFGYNDPFSFPDRFPTSYHNNYLCYTEFLQQSLIVNFPTLCRRGK